MKIPVAIVCLFLTALIAVQSWLCLSVVELKSGVAVLSSKVDSQAKNHLAHTP